MTKRSPCFSWNIGDIPFYYRPLSKPTDNNGFPLKLPFSLTIDTDTGTLIQRHNSHVERIVAQAYSQGSIITGIMDDTGIGKAYAEDFIKFMKESVPDGTFSHKKVLEIGCGTGYLLYCLKRLGADVCGIEPGKHGQEGSRKYGIPVVQAFFPSEQVHDTFDLLIMYSVLEHVKNPTRFLTQAGGYMTDDGMILLAVEDEESYLKHGDVSILFHEHISYFTKHTLYNTLKAGGFHSIKISSARFSKLLYATATINKKHTSSHRMRIKTSLSSATCFEKTAYRTVQNLARSITDASIQKKSIGIYVPGRAINFLSLVRAPLDRIRFFDDNPLLHKTYFPGIAIPIESRNDLIQTPVDILFIMSQSFGDKIRKELSAVLPDKMIMITWTDIFKE